MKKSISKYVKDSLGRFLKIESSSSVILGLSAVLAMIVANSSIKDFYFNVLETSIFGLSLLHWINDGLMVIFFFVVGLEIKREIVTGELSTVKKAALPVAAAIGGMIVPALFYYFFNRGLPSVSGWAVPMATDIAFALGVLMVFNTRVPLSLKIFLLALAIVDDLGAVLVIALIYTKNIKLLGLALAGVVFFIIFTLRLKKVGSYAAYSVLGILSWAAVLYAGVHATIAGVLLGLMTPVYFARKNPIEYYSPVDELIHKLHPWVSFGIMPVFALANAGVSLGGVNLGETFASPVSLGVFWGLVLGKPIGVLVASYLAVVSGIAKLPEGSTWKAMFGAACLAGIGFTMSIFITDLALVSSDALLSKLAIIAASVVAGVIGFFGILWGTRTNRSC